MVVIAFGVSNEGLQVVPTEVAAFGISDSYTEGIRELVNLTVAIGAVPVVCECLPPACNAVQYAALKGTTRRLKGLGRSSPCTRLSTTVPVAGRRASATTWDTKCRGPP